MKVQRITNFKHRMQEYNAECRGFWLKEFPAFAIIGALVIFPAMRGLSKIDTISEPWDWRLSAFFIWSLSLIPLIKMMHPEKPHPDDVLRDQALRRTVGMDDSVE